MRFYQAVAALLLAAGMVPGTARAGTVPGHMTVTPKPMAMKVMAPPCPSPAPSGKARATPKPMASGKPAPCFKRKTPVPIRGTAGGHMH